MAKLPSIVNPVARIAKPGQGRPMAGKDKSREEKLAEALRENLRRRKAQARELKPADKPKPD